MVSSILTLWTRSFPIKGESGLFLLLSCFIEISELNANSINPHQTPYTAVSDLGRHCLPMSLLWDARLIWVNSIFQKKMQIYTSFLKTIQQTTFKNIFQFSPGNRIDISCKLTQFDPLKPHFFIVKLGFTGVYLIFLISAQKHRYMKNIRMFHLKCFIFWW